MKVRENIWTIISPFLFCIGMVMYCVEFILRIVLNFVGFFMPFEDEIRFFSMKDNDFICNKVFETIMGYFCK